jgi:hypothetical protein
VNETLDSAGIDAVALWPEEISPRNAENRGMSPMPPALSKGGEEEILLSLFAHHCTQLTDSLLDAVHTSPLRQPYVPMSGVHEEEEHGALRHPPMVSAGAVSA